MGEKDSGLAPARSVVRREAAQAGRSVPRRVPSWPAVIVTTLRLWLDRRGSTRRAGRRRGWGLRALTVALAVGLAAAVATVVLVNLGPASGAAPGQGDVIRRGAGKSLAGLGGPAVVALALTRVQAAGWIAQQVSPDATVACDPAMCAALQAAGLPAGQLQPLRRSAAGPLSAALVVATPSVAGQFGTRLASVYAPQVIASFGSGATEIDIRSVAPDGAGSFQAAMAADLRARIAAGQRLLRNKNVHAASAARTALTAGSADPRLLVMLAKLAAREGMSIMSFDDPSPGAAGLPLREAEISAATTGQVRSMLSFLHAQRSPYLPAQARLVRVSRGRYLLDFQYDAPSPSGLLSGA